MEKPSQSSSVVKSLALAFGNGLLFGVAAKLVQGASRPSHTRAEIPQAPPEQLRAIEPPPVQSLTVTQEVNPASEAFDPRILKKVIAALEARLNEHLGQVDRRVAEIDAQVALDLKVLETRTSIQSSTFDKAVQQLERQLLDASEAASRDAVARISTLDHRLSAMEEALPEKLRTLVDAFRQTLQGQFELEMKELERRAEASDAVSQQVVETESRLRGEVEALGARLGSEWLARMAEHEERLASIEAGTSELRGVQTEIRQAIEAGAAKQDEAARTLDGKIARLEEEMLGRLLPLIESVAAVNSRLEALDRQAVEAGAAHEAVSARMEQMELDFREAHAGIVSQVESHVAGIAGRLESEDQRQAGVLSALDRKLSILQEELPPKLKALMDAVRDSLGARIAVEMRALDERHRTLIEGAEARLRATRETENISSKLNAALDALMTSFETRLAAEMRTVESRAQARANELEKTMHYVSMLEARIQTLEVKLQRNPEEVERAVERAWKSMEARQEKPAALPAPAEPGNAEALAELWGNSSDAEKSALELIAGISHLFEPQKPSVEPAPTPQPSSEPAPEAAEPLTSEDSDEKPPVILFKPKEPARKWRIPFVS
ncbi:MAG: hypothetical protein U0Q18_14740 [Bryobacteraceae bacterium]